MVKTNHLLDTVNCHVNCLSRKQILYDWNDTGKIISSWRPGVGCCKTTRPPTISPSVSNCLTSSLLPSPIGDGPGGYLNAAVAPMRQSALLVGYICFSTSAVRGSQLNVATWKEHMSRVVFRLGEITRRFCVCGAFLQIVR